MKTIIHEPGRFAASRGCVDGWTVEEFVSVSSTNLVAAALPAWHAVRAEVQTAGRGRFQRSWTSDAGGLWFSAVVPRPDHPGSRRALPLVVGLVVCEALQDLGIEPVRMRWPNDILVGNRKLAGLLLDQFRPNRIVAGIGINIGNDPEAHDDSLRGRTTRLAEWLSPPPAPADLMCLILERLRSVWDQLTGCGLAALLPRINRRWGPARLVELELDGRRERGLFTEVDAEGRLLLQDDSGRLTRCSPEQVLHLTEL